MRPVVGIHPDDLAGVGSREPDRPGADGDVAGLVSVVRVLADRERRDDAGRPVDSDDPRRRQVGEPQGLRAEVNAALLRDRDRERPDRPCAWPDRSGRPTWDRLGPARTTRRRRPRRRGRPHRSGVQGGPSSRRRTRASGRSASAKVARAGRMKRGRAAVAVAAGRPALGRRSRSARTPPARPPATTATAARPRPDRKSPVAAPASPARSRIGGPSARSVGTTATARIGSS